MSSLVNGINPDGFAQALECDRSGRLKVSTENDNEEDGVQEVRLYTDDAIVSSNDFDTISSGASATNLHIDKNITSQTATFANTGYLLGKLQATFNADGAYQWVDTTHNNIRYPYVKITIQLHQSTSAGDQIFTPYGIAQSEYGKEIKSTAIQFGDGTEADSAIFFGFIYNDLAQNNSNGFITHEVPNNNPNTGVDWSKDVDWGSIQPIYKNMGGAVGSVGSSTGSYVGTIKAYVPKRYFKLIIFSKGESSSSSATSYVRIDSQVTKSRVPF